MSPILSTYYAKRKGEYAAVDDGRPYTYGVGLDRNRYAKIHEGYFTIIVFIMIDNVNSTQLILRQGRKLFKPFSPPLMQ